MRDIRRIDKILNLIRNEWYVHPDMRIGQLLQNIADEINMDIFYMEDTILENYLEEKYFESMKK